MTTTQRTDKTSFFCKLFSSIQVLKRAMNNLASKLETLKENLDQNGFLVINGVLSQDEVSLYNGLYEDFISGKLDASNHRHDLGSHVELKTKAKENITQIMWPSLYLEVVM